MSAKKITPDDNISYKHVMIAYGIGKTEAYKKLNARRKDLRKKPEEQLTIKQFLTKIWSKEKPGIDLMKVANDKARRKKFKTHNDYIQQILIKNSNFDPQSFCDCLNAGKVAFPSKIYVNGLDLVYAYESVEQINFLIKKKWFYCKPRHLPLPEINKDFTSDFDRLVPGSPAKYKSVSREMSRYRDIFKTENVTIYQILEYEYPGVKNQNKREDAVRKVINKLL
jgi:hypothetical protein